MSGPPGRRWRLIALDDEEVQRRLLGFVFAGSPFALTVATSGEELLDLARQEAPDLVLLDIRMPRMDGFEVLRRLRADPRTASIPAVAVTANAAPDDLRRMDAAGFSTCVSKPYELDELLHTVEVTLLAPGRDHG